MSEAQARLSDRMAGRVGEPVTYTRSSDGATVLVADAVRGRHQPQRFAIADGRVSWDVEPQDWLILPASIAIGGVEFAPATGDRIEDARGNVYEVVNERDGEPGVRRSDNYGSMWRLRTILWQEGSA